MDAKSIEKACKQVFAKYPRLAGQSPRVSLQADGRYLLISHPRLNHEQQDH